MLFQALDFNTDRMCTPKKGKTLQWIHALYTALPLAVQTGFVELHSESCPIISVYTSIGPLQPLFQFLWGSRGRVPHHFHSIIMLGLIYSFSPFTWKGSYFLAQRDHSLIALACLGALLSSSPGQTPQATSCVEIESVAFHSTALPESWACLNWGLCSSASFLVQNMLTWCHC